MFKMVASAIALLMSSLLYFFAYHAYWYQSNGRPWLSEFYYKLYFLLFPAKPTDTSGISVQASDNSMLHEDKLILISFIISSILAFGVLLYSLWLRKKLINKQTGKLQAGLAAYASALVVMNLWFLVDNQLRL